MFRCDHVSKRNKNPCLIMCIAIVCETCDQHLPLCVCNVGHHGLTKKASVQSGSIQIPPPYNWDLRTSGLLDPWKSDRLSVPKCRLTASNLHCLTSQKSRDLSMILVNASDLPLWDAWLQLAPWYCDFQMSQCYLKLGHDYFLPLRFQLVINTDSTLVTLTYWLSR